MLDPLPISSFTSRRINSSTFLVIEDDSFTEVPYIYVKIYPGHIVITDTGCNSPRSKTPTPTLTALRQYLETYPQPSNDGSCLNPGGHKKYVIICSHCHYDHILGIPQFLSASPTIVRDILYGNMLFVFAHCPQIASNFDKAFLLEDFPTHSLCKFMGVETPKYDVSHWASHMSILSISQVPFRIQFLHVPGHTPDALAWYDIDEHHLYVGDTFYQRPGRSLISGRAGEAGFFQGQPIIEGAIIFPVVGGNWIRYMSSLEVLLSFVLYRNRDLRRRHVIGQGEVLRVKVGCGHLTYDADAEKTIKEVQTLFKNIICNKIPVTGSGEHRGVLHDFWLEHKDAKYSVLAPRYLVDQARDHFYRNGQPNHAIL